jgi:5-methyltetrahydrofolate--homocysteine methyltransferase
MTLKNKLKNDIILFDGGFGTMLQSAGLPAGVAPEEWNFSHEDEVEKIHSAYIEAGADVICANTFGINPFRYGDRCEEMVTKAIQIAKRAASGKGVYVLLDIGPSGKLIQPLGDLEFESAVEGFARVVRSAVKAGVDGVLVETMNDIYEAKAAVLAVKENSSLPVFASCVFGRDCKTMTGSTPETVVAVLEGLGVDALGLNCSLAPSEMKPTVERLLKCSSTPVIVKPNAGMPTLVEGRTVYTVEEEEFARDMADLMSLGVRVVGGCCGTTPEYIKLLNKARKNITAKKIEKKNLTVISSYTNPLYFGDIPVLIGERINPTGKKRLKEALKARDIGYILSEAVSQVDKGVHALDVNVGLPEIDEREMLTHVVKEIQAVTDLPLQIDTSDPVAMESAMRIYNGKPLVNSVNGKQECMREVFPLVKKYGGVVIALTLDESGIPSTAEGRVEIAKKIVKEAKKYGIEKKDIIFDTLAMTISADSGAGLACLDSLSYIRGAMGINTSLGVSNISFGLPQRDFINSTFFAIALNRGLSAAIMNPNSGEMIKAYKCYLALAGKDKNCLGYIDFASSVQSNITVQSATKAQDAGGGDLKFCIIKGLKNDSANGAKLLLKDNPPLDVINEYIIPALDEVGKGFEEKRVFLPQLLMSAEAASAAFDVIKGAFSGEGKGKKIKVVLATVKGDIHDIGKNIVKTLLENYGFTVIDLGRDVPPENVVSATIENGAQLVGLSALMTTTVGAMGETIKLLRESCPNVKVIVGGAVLTAEYADMLGADAYGKDAMATVRYAESLENEVE